MVAIKDVVGSNIDSCKNIFCSASMVHFWNIFCSLLQSFFTERFLDVDADADVD